MITQIQVRRPRRVAHQDLGDNHVPDRPTAHRPRQPRTQDRAQPARPRSAATLRLSAPQPAPAYAPSPHARSAASRGQRSARSARRSRPKLSSPFVRTLPGHPRNTELVRRFTPRQTHPSRSARCTCPQPAILAQVRSYAADLHGRRHWPPVGRTTPGCSCSSPVSRLRAEYRI